MQSPVKSAFLWWWWETCCALNHEDSYGGVLGGKANPADTPGKEGVGELPRKGKVNCRHMAFLKSHQHSNLGGRLAAGHIFMGMKALSPQEAQDGGARKYTSSHLLSSCHLYKSGLVTAFLQSE